MNLTYAGKSPARCLDGKSPARCLDGLIIIPGPDPMLAPDNYDNSIRVSESSEYFEPAAEGAQ